MSTARRRWRVRRRTLFHVIIVIAVVCIGMGAAALKWFARDLPSMARLEMIEPALKTRILAADSTVIKEYFEQNRILLLLAEIPPDVQRTFLAVEDRRFYQHFGIDFIRLLSVAVKDLRHWNRRQGASTITQQLSRDLFLTKEQTFPRKIKEALLALRIERTYSKDEILEMYLNQIFFGGGSYGIEAASRKFFGMPVRELELHQIALLAGLPRNPAGYNPFRHPGRALKRRAIVLKSMLDFSVIDSAQYEALKQKPLDVVSSEQREGGFAGYFTEHIRRILIQKYGLRAVQRGGLTVYTTIDPALQRVAEDSLETFLQQLEDESGYVNTRAAYLDSVAAGAEIKPDYLQSAAIALDPRTGHIKAWVGGRNFDESEWDRVYQAKKQPGSAFKVFIYIAALENGYSPSDILLDTPLVVEMPDGDVYKPHNFSKKFHGAVSLRFALNESINIPSIKLYQKVGGPSVVSTAHRMGIKSRLMPYLSLALGSYEVTLLEMTSAFSVLANEGIRSEPIAILQIVDRNGNILEEFREHHEEILSPEVAYMATDMLKTALEEGTGKSAKWLGLRVTAAGKTGTTDDYGDGWFIGFTPKLAVGVWTGFDEEIFMGNNKTGARVALPIWVDIMTMGHPGNEAPEFVRPPNIAEAIVCEETGLLATPYCKKVRREIFIEGMEPERHCDLHRVSPYDLMNPDKDFRDLDREASKGRDTP